MSQSEWTSLYELSSRINYCWTSVSISDRKLGPSGRGSAGEGASSAILEDGPVVDPANASDSRLRGDQVPLGSSPTKSQKKLQLSVGHLGGLCSDGPTTVQSCLNQTNNHLRNVNDIGGNQSCLPYWSTGIRSYFEMSSLHSFEISCYALDSFLLVMTKLLHIVLQVFIFLGEIFACTEQKVENSTEWADGKVVASSLLRIQKLTWILQKIQKDQTYHVIGVQNSPPPTNLSDEGIHVLLVSFRFSFSWVNYLPWYFHEP